MKKLYCVIGSKYRTFKNPKILIFEKTLAVLPIICGECKNEDEIKFQEGESIETLKILGLIENI